MKTMTCDQLGGACDTEFHASTFQEIAEMSKAHVKEMMSKQDEPHLKAVNDMKQLMKSPEAMQQWFENKRNEFNTLPDNS